MAEADPPPRAAVVTYIERVRPGATITPLAGDASTRRFFRVLAPNEPPAILMDYGAPFDGETDDVRLARIFRAAGLRTPEILSVVPDVGCLVLEDLGEMLLETALSASAPGEREALLARAVELAADLAGRGSHALAASERAGGPELDAERFRFEMAFFIDHYARGLRDAGSIDASLQEALDDLARLAAETPRRVLCHRDYHSRNLLVTAGGDLAMVDIQDARWGPDSYDLASLLRDAYVDIDETHVEGLIRHYLGRLDDPPRYEEFRRRFDVVSAQRMIKALGTFGHQIVELGRDRYTSAIPRTLNRLRLLLPSRPETRALHDRLNAAGLLQV